MLALCQRLDQLSTQFFALPDATKANYAMALGGQAWRGWFPLGGELTWGQPHCKQGLYLGSELTAIIPRCGPVCHCTATDLIPHDDVLPHFRQTVLDYMAQVAGVGHRVLAAMALSLGLPASTFKAHYTADPLILFRIFQYATSRCQPALTCNSASVNTPTTVFCVTLLSPERRR